MTGTVEFILRSLEERLRSSVEGIAYLGRERGQLEPGNSLIEWPCILIDSPGIHYERLPQGHVSAKARLSVKVVYPPYSPDVNDDGYGVLDMAAQVRAALNGHTTGEFGPLFCTCVDRPEQTLPCDCVRLIFETIWCEKPGDGATVPIQSIDMTVGV